VFIGIHFHNKTCFGSLNFRLIIFFHLMSRYDRLTVFSSYRNEGHIGPHFDMMKNDIGKPFLESFLYADFSLVDMSRIFFGDIFSKKVCMK